MASAGAKDPNPQSSAKEKSLFCVHLSVASTVTVSKKEKKAYPKS